MSSRLFNRNFCLILIGQAMSLFGSAILRFAVSQYVMDVTGSAAAYSTLVAISTIPLIFLTPLGGIVADRLNRRNLMVLLDAVCGGIAIGLWFVLGRSDSLIPVAVVLFLISVVSGFQDPVVQSSVPMVQAGEHLTKSTSLVMQVTTGAFMIGPMLGGVLYNLAGIQPIILASCVWFFLAAGIETFIRVPHIKLEHKGNALRTVASDLKAGIGFIIKERPAILKALFLLGAMAMLVTPFPAIGIPYLVRVTLSLGSDLSGYAEGGIAAAGMVGVVAAGLLADKVKMRKLHIPAAAIGVVLFPAGAAFLLGLSRLTTYGILLGCCMGMQAIASGLMIFTLPAIQRQTPKPMMGRVMSFVCTFNYCFQPLGQIGYGFMYDRFRGAVYVVIFTTAVAMLLVGLRSRRVFVGLEWNSHIG